MADIKELEQKKKKTFRAFLICFIMFYGLMFLDIFLMMLCIKTANSFILPVISLVGLLVVVNIVYTDYQNASTKLEIFKELEEKYKVK